MAMGNIYFLVDFANLLAVTINNQRTDRYDPSRETYCEVYLFVSYINDAVQLLIQTYYTYQLYTLMELMRRGVSQQQ
jgi:hypothetical protein